MKRRGQTQNLDKESQIMTDTGLLARGGAMTPARSLIFNLNRRTTPQGRPARVFAAFAATLQRLGQISDQTPSHRDAAR